MGQADGDEPASYAVTSARQAPPSGTAPGSGHRSALDRHVVLAPLVRPVLDSRPIARGPRAEAIFAHCPETPDRGTRPGRRGVEIVVADTTAGSDGSRPTVVLSDHPRLAVPAFDMSVHNPVGWRRNVDYRVASLGSLDLLPSHAEARYALKGRDLDHIRLCHHIEDVRAFHDGPEERAGTLVRLAATGAPVSVLDDDPQLEALLGGELYKLLRTDAGHTDATVRELHSIRLRRAALRDHAADARVRQLCRAVGEEAPEGRPNVSVLLATRRPGFLLRAVANVAKQDYPRLELVLALHGDGFGDRDIARAVAPLAIPVQIVRADAHRAFPDVLNAATAAASGDLVTKMDDDDLYDAHHVWDLVLAWEYSAAHLVGKGVEVVYLARLNQTVEPRRNGGERDTTHVAGGTMLVSRDDLGAIGGWQGVPPYVDRTLIDDIVRAGGRVYQTHGSGYVLVRHGERHSWNADDEHFLNNAKAVHSGFRPSVAGMEAEDPVEWPQRVSQRIRRALGTVLRRP